MTGLSCACLLTSLLLAFPSAVATSITLWQGTPDRLPPYFSHANVSLLVDQDGDQRSFLWTAAWLDGSIVGEINMGSILCPMPAEGLQQVAEVPLDQRTKLALPCDIRDEEQLLAGSDIVRQIVTSVAAMGAKRVAMVGLGPGAMATALQRFHPEVESVDVVEISGVVVDVAHRYFGLQPDKRLRLHLSEGMEWLEQAEAFDVLVHDATGSQHHFLRPASLRLIRQKADAMLINILGTPRTIRPLLLLYLRLHFPEVRASDHVVVASWRPLGVLQGALPAEVQLWWELGVWVLQQGGTLLLLGLLVVYVVSAVRAKSKRMEEEVALATRLHPRTRLWQAAKEGSSSIKFSTKTSLSYGIL